MTTTTHPISGSVNTTTEERNSSPINWGYSRINGLFYVVLFVIGMFSPLVIESIVTRGETATTAQNLIDNLQLFEISLVTWFAIAVIDIAISVTLYRLVEPSGRTTALLMASFRVGYSVILGILVFGLVDSYRSLDGVALVTNSPVIGSVATDLEGFLNGFQFALMFFGVHLSLLGVALIRSGVVSKLLGGILTIAGVGYIVDGWLAVFYGAHNDDLSIALLTPALIGELALTVWLLRGRRKAKNS